MAGRGNECLVRRYLLLPALLSKHDEAHERARAIASDLKHPLVTSAWILTEVGDALASQSARVRFASLYEFLRSSPLVTIVPPDSSLFEEGIGLYLNRPDKDWSLTDCISFTVMQREGLREALIGDHHFEQAGFKILL
ncbi:MAG: type II toxin-antitoxin system VapC family toxin [Planctomycetes bacterium]|nr:type II toxin-antitoxin system VapC family toxin [Planctomycetota bacterium]